MAIIPLIVYSNNLNNSEAALNYFLVQALSSATLIFAIIIIILINNLLFINFTLTLNNIPDKLILISIIIKLGAAPFHFWFPNVLENCNWNNNLLLITWQKIGPIIILIYFIKLDNIMLVFILLTTLTGAIGGFNQTSLRKILAFSSINHLGWIFIAIMYNENLWFIYLTVYSFLIFCLIYLFKILKIFYLSQVYIIFINKSIVKLLLLISILSLGGLPPFLGFFPKWIIIQSIRFLNLNFIGLFLICIRIITLFYYLKIRFAAFIINYYEHNFNYKNFIFNNQLKLLIIINIISLTRFFYINNIFYYL